MKEDILTQLEWISDNLEQTGKDLREMGKVWDEELKDRLAKGISNQFDTMVRQCQSMNADKIIMSFKREDGYTIDITTRRTEAKFDDEFSNKELKYIKETMIEKISSVSNKEAAEKAFDIVNVCQELLGEPLFNSVDEIVNSTLQNQ